VGLALELTAEDRMFGEAEEPADDVPEVRSPPVPQLAG
jgi:hypothetical protein